MTRYDAQRLKMAALIAEAQQLAVMVLDKEVREQGEISDDAYHWRRVASDLAVIGQMVMPENVRW